MLTAAFLILFTVLNINVDVEMKPIDPFCEHVIATKCDGGRGGNAR